MKYTLEIPDQDVEFVLEVLRRLASVELIPVGRRIEVENGPEHPLDGQISHALLLKAGEHLKQIVQPQSAGISAQERARRFEAVAGSWQSEESGDELNQQLRAARYFRDRDVEL